MLGHFAAPNGEKCTKTGVEPEHGQHREPEFRHDATECERGHVEPGQTADEHADAQVHAPHPAVEAYKATTDAGKKLERAETDRDRGGKDVRVNAGLVREEGSFHVRMDDATQR